MRKLVKYSTVSGESEAVIDYDPTVDTTNDDYLCAVKMMQSEEEL